MVGPVPRPPAWSGMQQSLCKVRDCVASCSSDTGATLLDKAYCTWARLAEIELQGVTGCDIRLGHRASKPVLVRKTFKNKSPAFQWGAKGNARSLEWLKGRALEVEGLIASPGMNR
eukprot:3485384-Heterocapsa_arctica.AAC.1